MWVIPLLASQSESNPPPRLTCTCHRFSGHCLCLATSHGCENAVLGPLSVERECPCRELHSTFLVMSTCHHGRWLSQVSRLAGHEAEAGQQFSGVPADAIPHGAFRGVQPHLQGASRRSSFLWDVVFCRSYRQGCGCGEGITLKQEHGREEGLCASHSSFAGTCWHRDSP